jgi:chemotaxis protein CheY-P-specific phosphatase CheC
MDGYKKLQDILSSALQQAGEESGMLLGQELSISLLDSIKTTKTTFFGDLDDSCFVIGVDSREAYPGQFYLIFSLRDAIVLSSTLLGIPPARVKEKQRLSILENDDIDAFSEIGNMINGSFNTLFQGSLPNKVHLKVLVPKKFIPDIDQINEEEPSQEGFVSKEPKGSKPVSRRLATLFAALDGPGDDLPGVVIPPEEELDSDIRAACQLAGGQPHRAGAVVSFQLTAAGPIDALVAGQQRGIAGVGGPILQLLE